MKKEAIVKYSLFVCVAMLFLGGCSANYHAIHKLDHFDAEQDAVLSVDAKQRFLIGKFVRKVNDKTIRRYCAEPSPDVFSVLGQSASGGASFGQSADPKSINIALQGAFTSSETGSTIARTQTINMLKEMMYRTCERYLNGAINKEQFAVIAARDQRIMTSILAIEQLTGTIQPKPTVIAVNGNASTGQTSADAMKTLSDAKSALDGKKDDLDKAQKDFDEVNDSAGPSCEELKAKDDVKGDEKTKLDKCKHSQTSLDKADEAYKDARRYYEAQASLADKPGVSSVSTTAALLSSTPATTEYDLQIEQSKTERITAVAETVDRIVGHSFDRDDETAFFCYGAMKSNDPELKDSCQKFLLAKTKSRTAQLQKEIEKAKQEYDAESESLFKEFWKKINPESDLSDSKKVKAIIDKKIANSFFLESDKKLLEAMKKAKTRDALWAAFRDLPADVMQSLASD